MNVVIVVGRLSSAPRCTQLPSGTDRWNLELSTEGSDGRTSGVPVTWDGAVPDRWVAGTPLAVTGSVRRRFFRTGAATQSRTEVVATAVVEITNRRPEAVALARAMRSHEAPTTAALRSLFGGVTAA